MTDNGYRRLYKSFVFGQRICSISRDAEMFFWRLYVIADDYGNFEVEPKTLVAKAGGLRKIKLVEVQAWIKEMEKIGLIKIYQAENKSYGHFISFSKYQVPSGPAQSPDFGMQRYCPESPWDKHPVVGDSAELSFSNFSLNQEKIQLLNTNTNTKTRNNNNNTSSRTMRRDARGSSQEELFSDPNAFAEEYQTPNPREQEFILEAFKYWQKVCNHPFAHMTPIRVDRLKRRFKDSTLKEVKQAIDGCAKSDYHMGRQPNNPTLYNDIELICRHRHKLEMFMEKVTFNPKKDSWEEKKRRSDEAKAKWYGKK